MLDLIFVIAFALIPLAIIAISRSFTWAAVAMIFGFGIAGNAVQSSISLGMSWHVRELQWLSLVTLIVIVGFALVRRRAAQGEDSSLKRQLLVIGLPILVIGVALIVLRLSASEHPGPLSAVGYLINHPLAEDNAKWLNLSAQLADGREIAFNGYAGGPLLLLMSMMAALISTLSSILLGGVNQVAVAANTVIGVQFLLIALVPIALAPFAERRVGGRALPAPVIWAGMLTLFIGSAVVTSYGHLSLQFILIILTLWSAVFLAKTPGQARLLSTLAIATSASVWLPLNVLGLVLLIACLVLAIKHRDWIGLAAVVLTALSVWDALFSSVLFVFGIQLGSTSATSDVAGAVTDSASGGSGPVQISIATDLFAAPGAVETIAPLVGGLTLASLIFVVWQFSKADVTGRVAKVLPLIPIAVLAGYMILIQVSDAIATGQAPHYGGHKLVFALTMMVLASTLPLAISGLEPHVNGMSMLRWFAIGGVVVLLTVDTMLPRAISALSPSLWPAVNKTEPQYWSAAEVRDSGTQSLATEPIACLTAPPDSPQPTALPKGQESYACTRLLIGLTGQEGKTGSLNQWLLTDWLSNSSKWNDFYPALATTSPEIANRPILMMKATGKLAGLTTLDSLLSRYPAQPTSTS